MKVGIVTLHRSFSFGACLQAYATYKAISDMGHEVEFVDYVNAHEQDQNHWISRKKNVTMVKNAMTTLLNVVLCRYRNNFHSFHSFHKRYQTTQRYTNIDSMENLQYDVLVSGSDQLWNPEIFNSLDEVFFLNFGKATKRIAYAASAGSYTYTQEEKQRLAPLLNQYYAISARENHLKTQVEEICGKDVPVVLDPTFLLQPEQWLDISNEEKFHVAGKYILLYMVGVPYSYYKTHYGPIVKFYKEKLDIPVYVVSNTSFITYYGCDKNLTRLTPLGLIHAINNAELIISSSFHGIAFSVNLNKKFVALKTTNSQRVSNLLQLCEMEERFIDSLDPEKCEALLDEVDFSSANANLQKMRLFSYNWLKEQLRNEND